MSILLYTNIICILSSNYTSNVLFDNIRIQELNKLMSAKSNTTRNGLNDILLLTEKHKECKKICGNINYEMKKHLNDPITRPVKRRISDNDGVSNYNIQEYNSVSNLCNLKFRLSIDNNMQTVVSETPVDNQSSRNEQVQNFKFDNLFTHLELNKCTRPIEKKNEEQIYDTCKLEKVLDLSIKSNFCKNIKFKDQLENPYELENNNLKIFAAKNNIPIKEKNKNQQKYIMTHEQLNYKTLKFDKSRLIALKNNKTSKKLIYINKIFKYESVFMKINFNYDKYTHNLNFIRQIIDQYRLNFKFYFKRDSKNLSKGQRLIFQKMYNNVISLDQEIKYFYSVLKYFNNSNFFYQKDFNKKKSQKSEFFDRKYIHYRFDSRLIHKFLQKFPLYEYKSQNNCIIRFKKILSIDSKLRQNNLLVFSNNILKLLQNNQNYFTCFLAKYSFKLLLYFEKNVNIENYDIEFVTYCNKLIKLTHNFYIKCRS